MGTFLTLSLSSKMRNFSIQTLIWRVLTTGSVKIITKELSIKEYIILKELDYREDVGTISILNHNLKIERFLS